MWRAIHSTAAYANAVDGTLGQPHHHLPTLGVDVAHPLNLSFTLGQVFLVDAEGIYPDSHPLLHPMGLSESEKRCIKILCDTDRTTIDLDGFAAIGRPPHIG